MARPSQRAPTADAERPPPNPNAVVVAGVQQSGETMRIEFPFALATPAAVFQRADALWLVFDTPTQIDLTAIQADNDNGVRDDSEPYEKGALVTTGSRVTDKPTDDRGTVLVGGLAPFTPVAVALSAKNGATAAVLAPAFSVTANTAGADAGALPEVPGADALTRIFPLYTATASVPPSCGSGDGV